MFQLTPPREPEWFDAAEGIRLRLRFGPTEALNTARRGARLSGLDAARVDPEFAFVFGAAVWGVIEWEGLGDPEWQGEDTKDCPPAPVTPANLLFLLSQRPDVYDAFADYYVDPLMELLAEKKGSRTSLNGTSATAPGSAKRARRTAPSAPTN